MPPKEKKIRSRAWFFTYNNYSTENLTQLHSKIKSLEVDYVFQEELGLEGTPHIQGCMRFKNPVYISFQKNFTNKIHWERCRSWPKSIQYCTKRETRINNTVYSNIKGLKIGVPAEYIGEGVSAEAKTAVMEALKVLESLGAEWEEVSLPHSKYASEVYYVISSSEASSNLARFDGIRYGYRAEGVKDLEELYARTRSEAFGDEVKKRILFGMYSLGAAQHGGLYVKSQKVRTLIAQDFANLFEKYDVIIGPSSATTAYKIGEKLEDPLTLYANDILTVPINLAGVPAISVPCGFSNGLPLGLQIIGKHYDEATLYKVAHAYEQATDFHTQTPVIWEGK